MDCISQNGNIFYASSLDSAQVWEGKEGKKGRRRRKYARAQEGVNTRQRTPTREQKNNLFHDFFVSRAPVEFMVTHTGDHSGYLRPSETAKPNQ